MTIIFTLIAAIAAVLGMINHFIYGCAIFMPKWIEKVVAPVDPAKAEEMRAEWKTLKIGPMWRRTLFFYALAFVILLFV